MMEQQHFFLNEGDQYWERRTVRYRDCENSDSNSKSLFYKDCSSERFFELKNTSFGPWSHASRSLACLMQTHTQNEGCSENIPVDISEGMPKNHWHNAGISRLKNRFWQHTGIKHLRTHFTQQTEEIEIITFCISFQKCPVFVFSNVQGKFGRSWLGGRFLSISFCQCTKWSNS